MGFGAYESSEAIDITCRIFSRFYGCTDDLSLLKKIRPLTTKKNVTFWLFKQKVKKLKYMVWMGQDSLLALTEDVTVDWIFHMKT